MPEILEERFGRAKSGLMLAPASAQALKAIFPQVITDLEMLPPIHGSKCFEILDRDRGRALR
jgi:hypothetical protein